MERPNSTINCAVGILTFNSGNTLERCLKSINDFKEIIISDSNSTDDTLEIARNYNCKIISQTNAGKPIEDFAKERNRILDAVSYDWFFYLDSDEIMSEELKNGIRRITESPKIDFFVYRVRYQIVSSDLKTKYRSFKPYYQARFFNKKCGARFVRKVHEKIAFDESKYRIGSIESPWFVPLDVQLDFRIYSQKINCRIEIMVNELQSKNFLIFLYLGIFKPFLEIFKYFIKIFYLNLMYNRKEIIPLKYEFYRIYSQFVLMKKMLRRYSHLIFFK